jgi:hypothetical protein
MKIFIEFDNVADKIANKFNEVYFDGEAEYYWVADDRSGLIQINDHFVTLADMLYALKNKVSVKGFFDYYEASLEGTDEEPYQSKYTNLRHYMNTIRTSDLPEKEQAKYFMPEF